MSVNESKTKIPNKVEVGQLFRVHTSFFANKTGPRKRQERVEMLPKDILEIRYATAWNFRNQEDEYFHASEEDILKYCVFFGIIDGETVFKNGHRLSRILEERLFQTVNDLLFNTETKGRDEL